MKILISDFDKTLYTENYLENINLVNQFVDEGNIFVIATGRPLYLLLPEILEYNIKYDYLICNDGAVIFNKQHNLLYQNDMSSDDAVNIFNELSQNSNIKECYIDNIFMSSTSFKEPYNGIIARPKNKEDALILIDKITSKYPNIQSYLSHSWINVLNKEASKGKAIHHLIELNKWDISDVVTIGDNSNDASMMDDFDSYAIIGENKNILKGKHMINSFKDLMDIIL